jgi:hypothetical protein
MSVFVVKLCVFYNTIPLQSWYYLCKIKIWFFYYIDLTYILCDPRHTGFYPKHETYHFKRDFFRSVSVLQQSTWNVVAGRSFIGKIYVYFFSFWCVIQNINRYASTGQQVSDATYDGNSMDPSQILGIFRWGTCYILNSSIHHGFARVTQIWSSSFFS